MPHFFYFLLLVLTVNTNRLNDIKEIFFLIIRSSSKVYEAMELYHQAANKFKMAKKWGSAGQAFTELANLHLKSGSRLDASTNFIEAGNCYKKTDPNGK